MKIWKEVFRKNRAGILAFAVMTAANAAVFALYGVLAEPLTDAERKAVFHDNFLRLTGYDPA